MANWNKSITLEVIVHYETQGLTIGKQTYQITLFSDAVWIGEDGKWKADYDFGGGRSLRVSGKCTHITPMLVQPTTYKIKVFDKEWREYIKAKVISHS